MHLTVGCLAPKIQHLRFTVQNTRNSRPPQNIQILIPTGIFSSKHDRNVAKKWFIFSIANNTRSLITHDRSAETRAQRTTKATARVSVPSGRIGGWMNPLLKILLPNLSLYANTHPDSKLKHNGRKPRVYDKFAAEMVKFELNNNVVVFVVPLAAFSVQGPFITFRMLQASVYSSSGSNFGVSKKHLQKTFSQKWHPYW